MRVSIVSPRCALAVLSLFPLLAHANDDDKVYKHVAVFSVDGLHPSDVTKYIAMRPGSTFEALLKTGYEYTDASTTGPSDSFPGTLAQFTGAGPRTTGVWYDDTYDRSYFAPGSDCSGKPGSEGRPFPLSWPTLAWLTDGYSALR